MNQKQLEEKIEKSVDRFAVEMKKALLANAHKGNWSKVDREKLGDRLVGRSRLLALLSIDIDGEDPFEPRLERAAHIANIAMILAEQCEVET